MNRLDNVVRATTLEDIRDAIVAHDSLRISGGDSRAEWRLPSAAQTNLQIGLTGIIDHFVTDQVVVVNAGTPIAALQEELKTKGQCLPFIDAAGTVGGAVSMNLPHALEANAGSWRDWVLGMTIVQADGTVCKCGSNAVKNVAGYDVQRLLVGSRGTLAVISTVTLRTIPIASRPEPQIEKRSPTSERPVQWTQRVLKEHIDEALEAPGIEWHTIDRSTNTIVGCAEPGIEPKRFPGDWVLGRGAGERNLQITDPTQIKFMKRAKAIFDPTNKLNPGEMGIF